MMPLRVSATAVALTSMGLLSGCGAAAAERARPDGATSQDAPVVAAATRQSLTATGALPDVGTKMPDGRVYAGLSMDTGKPLFVAAAGITQTDGTIFAGFSPDRKKDLYTTASDAPGVYTWREALEYCSSLSAFGHHDWRMPTIIELAVQFNNRADIGGFNETGSLQGTTGYYWSSLQIGDDDAWAQRFNDGFHEGFSKSDYSLLRCVR